MFNLIKSNISEIILIEPSIYTDDRGYVKETYRSDKLKEIGVDADFVQENYARSIQNVIRGLHYQKNNPQGKLITCMYGTVFDVAVDIREDSSTYGQYVSTILSDENHRQIWIPPGFAHGFCVLSSYADLNYKFTDYYDPNDAYGLIWNDPSISIDWPISYPLLSAKDSHLPTLQNLV